MLLKFIGAFCVIIGCGAVGFRIAAVYRYEEKCMRQLLDTVSYMIWELNYRLTPLPTLCRQAASRKNGAVYRFLLNLANEMDAQLSPNVALCCKVCLDKQKDLPTQSRKLIEILGSNLGKFDLDGQIDSLNTLKAEIQRQLESHCKDKDVRIRSYQTLGLCAGAAMAILFV